MAATITNHAVSSISGDVTPSALFLAPNKVDWTKSIRRQDTPFQSLIGRKANKDNPISIKKEWAWSYPDADYDQLNGAYTSGGATITLDDASKVQVGSLLIIESEEFLATAVNESTNVVTVTGGYAGTTPANHVDNMSVMILPPAIAENQATPLSPITQGEKDYNYFQQMEWGIQFSHRSKVVPTQETLSMAMGDRGEAQLRKLMEDTIPNLLENALLFGNRYVGTTSAPGTMGGIFNTSSFVTTTASVSGALTYGTLMTYIEQVNRLVPSKEIGKTIMAHPLVIEIISSFFDDIRRASTTDTKITTHWNEVTNAYGTFKLVPNHKMVKTAANGHGVLDKLIFFSEDDLDLVPLSGDSGWSIDPLPEEGWYTKAAVRGDYTLTAPNPDSRLIISGFSVTRSDYAGLS